MWPGHWPTPEEIDFKEVCEMEAPVTYLAHNEDGVSLPHLNRGQHYWKALMRKPAKLFIKP